VCVLFCVFLSLRVTLTCGGGFVHLCGSLPLATQPQQSLVSSFVELAICSEKLADQRDSQPARKQASSRPTPGQKPLSATNLRKKALSFCDESLSRNEGAKDPVMFVRAYYCIAKVGGRVGWWCLACGAVDGWRGVRCGVLSGSRLWCAAGTS